MRECWQAYEQAVTACFELKKDGSLSVPVSCANVAGRLFDFADKTRGRTQKLMNLLAELIYQTGFPYGIAAEFSQDPARSAQLIIGSNEPFPFSTDALEYPWPKPEGEIRISFSPESTDFFIKTDLICFNNQKYTPEAIKLMTQRLTRPQRAKIAACLLSVVWAEAKDSLELA